MQLQSDVENCNISFSFTNLTSPNQERKTLKPMYYMCYGDITRLIQPQHDKTLCKQLAVNITLDFFFA